MPGRIEFETKFSSAGKERRRRSQDSPMQILFMGDFSGHGGGVAAETQRSQLRKLDLDNFSQLMTTTAPRVAIAVGDNPADVMDIEFKTLEDFHPDRLFDRLPLFQHLKTLRANLGNPATFAQAAAQLSGIAASAAPLQTNAQPPVEDDSGLLDQLLGDRAAHIATEPTSVLGEKRVDINAFIKNAIAPHIEMGAHPQQDQYIASVDRTVSELMRKILHHPEFQALEAAWRGVYEFITRLEWDEPLNIHVLDIRKEELLSDLQQCGNDISVSSLYRTVVEQSVQTLGGEPWSVLVGLYSFTHEEDDIVLLSKLGQVAFHSGGPFIAAAHPRLLGCESLVKQPDASQWQVQPEMVKTWSELRDQPYAAWLALAFPRILMRLPYGSKTDEIERFQFEELAEDLTEEQRHSSYLWGNPAIVSALLIAQSYQQSSWSMSLGDVLEVEDLPLHIYEAQGEKIMTPCAEVVMSERSAETIETYGVMPIMSYKNRNAVRLWRFRSLRRNNPGLAGPWGS